MRRWKAGGLVIGLLALGLVAGIASRGAGTETALAQAARTWDVQIGAFDEATGAETQAYYPNVLTINVGIAIGLFDLLAQPIYRLYAGRDHRGFSS